MSVALIRDGVIRPSENDSHVLTAMLLLVLPAKPRGEYSGFCRMAR